MRVTCLVVRVGHHTGSGGYDRLAAAVSAKVIMRKQISGLLGKALNKIWQRLRPKQCSTEYQIGDWLAEIQLLATCFFRGPDVVHVLYSGQIYLLIKWRGLLRCPLILTFHAPVEYVVAEWAAGKNTRPHRFDTYGLNLDIGVALATSEIMPLQRWIEPHKIVYIPHGVDTDRFRPNGQILDPDKMRVLVVGFHMRDWVVIHRTIDEINCRRLNVEFHIVEPHDGFRPYFTGCATLVYHSQISESELIGLYRSADVLFVPMTNATANNAILEALACGTPVISTLVGGIPDYVDDESGWLLPVGDVGGHVNLIALLAANRELAWRRRGAARTQALKFDWRLVAEQMMAAYATVRWRRSRLTN
jgi:glycosyltransferase involved in cell wall biosynthesis